VYFVRREDEGQVNSLLGGEHSSGLTPIVVGPEPAWLHMHPDQSRGRPLTPEMQAQMIRLSHGISFQLHGIRGKLIQFVGVDGGEGTSELVATFGNVIASQAFISVASIELEKINLDVEMYGSTNFPNTYGLNPNTQLRSLLGQALLLANEGRQPNVTSTQHTTQLHSKWTCRRIDLTILDSAPFSRSASSLAVLPAVDGVILVMQAERTSRGSIKRALGTIESCGGRCLGIIFNKSRRHIPRFLERWL